MRLRLQAFLDSLQSSFWFTPAWMTFVTALAALGTVAIDRRLDAHWVENVNWIWSGGPDGAANVLSVIAGSMMTVVSIVFSLVLSTLAQTASHFGPRVLRNFSYDGGVKITLGTFIATFIYCLLVLRTVRSVEERPFVPYLSVNIGLALSVVSLAVLIYFIHHVAQMIQGENLISEVGADFQESLDDMLRNAERTDEQSQQSIADFEALDWDKAAAVEGSENGYLQRIAMTKMVHLATRHHLQIRLVRRPGDFVPADSPLLLLLPAERVTDDIARRLCRCFSLGAFRTPFQDALYSIQQLVEMASRALSPGINEPATALNCIDWLGSSLRSVMRRGAPSPYHFDGTGKVRVRDVILTFPEYAAAAFDGVRHCGSNNPEIMLRMLDTILDIAPDMTEESHREVLQTHAKLIGESARQIVMASDRERVQQRLSETLRVLASIALS